jgi:uncharacterized damage-inducible protein DinB
MPHRSMPHDRRMASRIEGFRGEFLWELEIVERQTLALAEGIPQDKYDWRPAPTARSVSEVFAHVAVGNFMLVDIAGRPAPEDVYAGVPPEGQEHFWGLVKRNDELERGLRDKAAVIDLLRRSFHTAGAQVAAADEPELNRTVQFFGEETTIRRVFLRLLAHTHEHMGQMIGYVRGMGLEAPWRDWRPDRR